MKALSITNDQASAAWNSMVESGAFDASHVIFDFIGPEDDELFGEIELITLADELDDVMVWFGQPNRTNGGEIDSAIVEPVHKALNGKLTPFQLSQLGFWRWLSNMANNGFFWNFIYWRLQSDHQINWGITSQGSIVEVYFYRAWIRAHKMIDLTMDDPYYYAKKGASDVWRSHILRQDIGRDREFVKAFLDTIYTDEGEVRIGTDELRKVLIPTLRAWTSGASFSHLSYSENKKLIDQLMKEGI